MSEEPRYGCWELLVLSSASQKVGPNGPGPWTDEGPDFCLSADGEEALDRILTPFGWHTFTWLWSAKAAIKRGMPLFWAMIIWTRDFRLAGHVAEVRGDKRSMSFTSFSIPPTDAVPPVSCIMVNDRQALARAATRSALLAPAWEMLADAAPERHWLCICPPPPAEWVAEQERDDDDRVARIFGLKPWTNDQNTRRLD